MLWSVSFLVCVIASAAQESCVGICGHALDQSRPCQCNSHCVVFGDCCYDYQEVCVAATCNGRCGDSLDSSKPCQCNAACSNHGDCCPDYDDICLGGGGETLSGVMNEIWNLDENRVSVNDYTVNYQSQVSSGNTGDSASGPLFSFLRAEVLTRPTISLFLQLLDNYNPTVGSAETLTSAEWQEIEAFLDAIIPTAVMQRAYSYLLREGATSSPANFRDVLRELWFNLYTRSSSGSSPDSSGFEHVMVGEYNNGISGFHSWLQFYNEEAAGRLDYQGHVSKADPEMVGAQFVWNGRRKSKGSFFIATSPEFDLAVYTICALLHTNSVCSFDMAGHSIRIQTWDVGHKNGIQIGSAYPL